MPSIFVSEAARRKIEKDRELHAKLVGRRLMPRLLYYERSYMTMPGGEVIELGAGLTLGFADQDDVLDDYLQVYLEEGELVLLGPTEFFASGMHLIDLVDEELKVRSKQA